MNPFLYISYLVAYTNFASSNTVHSRVKLKRNGDLNLKTLNHVYIVPVG